MSEGAVEKPKRKGRGPGKKPALFVTSIRITQEVRTFFDTHYPKSKQAVMRQVLTDFMMRTKATQATQAIETQGANHEPQEDDQR